MPGNFWGLILMYSLSSEKVSFNKSQPCPVIEILIVGFNFARGVNFSLSYWYSTGKDKVVVYV